MTDTPLRPRSITEIVDTSFTLYRRHFLSLVMVSAIAYAPYIVYATFRGATPSDSVMGSVMNTLVAMVLAIVSYSLVAGAVNQIGSQAYLHGSVDIERAIRVTIERVPALVIGGLLLSLATFVGVLCLIVGAFYVAARFFAVTPVIALEGTDAFSAFSRSSTLSDGRKWSILGTLALVYGIYFLLSLGISVFTIPAMLAGHAWIAVLVGSAFTVIIYPIAGLATMVLYYYTRIRAEGFDVEHLSAQLDGSMNAAPTPGS